MKAAIYVRVSTEDQDTDNQLRDLSLWAANRGWTISEVYTETESAWRAGQQAELRRLRDDAARGKFRVLLVWALDRLSREGPLVVLQLVNSLKQRGVTVLSYQEPWTEIDGPMSELLYSITSWVARFESERRSERTKAGMARAKAAGVHCGRPFGSKDTRIRKRRRL